MKAAVIEKASLLKAVFQRFALFEEGSMLSPL
jgi:hypothetical protein